MIWNTHSPVPINKEQRHAQWNAMVAELAARTKAERALQHIQLDHCPDRDATHPPQPQKAKHRPSKPQLPVDLQMPQKKRFSLSGAVRRLSNGSGITTRRRFSNDDQSGNCKAVRRFSNGLKSSLRGSGRSDTRRRRASMSGVHTEDCNGQVSVCH